VDILQPKLNAFRVGEGKEFDPFHGARLRVHTERETVGFEGREVLEDDHFLQRAQFQGLGSDQALFVQGGGALRAWEGEKRKGGGR
jgi:hypothetical protein